SISPITIASRAPPAASTRISGRRFEDPALPRKGPVAGGAAHCYRWRVRLERWRAMMLCIPEVLTRAELEQMRTALAGAEFADGKATAGYRGRRVKNNLQLSRENAAGNDMALIIEQALWRSETFGWAVWPKQIRGILFSRYEPGMAYGNHVDNAIMGKANLWRSDVAFTLFLAD